MSSLTRARISSAVIGFPSGAVQDAGCHIVADGRVLTQRRGPLPCTTRLVRHETVAYDRDRDHGAGLPGTGREGAVRAVGRRRRRGGHLRAPDRLLPRPAGCPGPRPRGQRHSRRLHHREHGRHHPDLLLRSRRRAGGRIRPPDLHQANRGARPRGAGSPRVRPDRLGTLRQRGRRAFDPPRDRAHRAGRRAWTARRVAGNLCRGTRPRPPPEPHRDPGHRGRHPRARGRGRRLRGRGHRAHRFLPRPASRPASR